ncbi:hypothetical protein [Kribbella albertanoniae]|uniref:Uncharacterized protein n=1 Tax=Kribbella albertanoniae TaxID=1266829 RepID=A0A4R4QAP7_9ACTN|nr:hypothetical protein [Kribbella albertanoniae]TDC32408.1 hypothetical protein E1261_08650 [Kribbella albertanoniae]
MSDNQAESVDCSEAAQADGDCIGWAGTAGANPLAAVISSALLQDKSGAARKFYEEHCAEADQTTADLIEEALVAEAVAGGSRAARILAPLVYPSPKVDTSRKTVPG